MPRLSTDVVSQLLEQMESTVSDYGTLKRTNATLETIIQGTAFFPGGSGLWRGENPYGPLPEVFPERTVMFAAHNFDKESSYRKSLSNRGEFTNDLFWVYMRAYINEAGLSESQCFFTNVLMGLQPLKATGPMDATTLFRQQCEGFFLQQVEIVKPRCVAILGDDAVEMLQNAALPVVHHKLRHPSWLKYQKAEKRAAIIKEQGAILRSLLRRTGD